MLTPKQEKFVQCILEGKSQADAYRAAYNTENMSNNAIYVEASILMENPKVSLRIQELRNQAANAAGGAVMTRNEKRKMLAEMARDEKLTARERQAAIDIDNKMEDEYITRVEADVKNEVTINIELSDEE